MGCCCWEGPHVRVNVQLARLPRPRRHQRHGAVIKVETNRTQTCLLLLLLLLGVHRHVPGRLYKCTSPDVNNTVGVRQLPCADGMMEFLGKANAKNSPPFFVIFCTRLRTVPKRRSKKQVSSAVRAFKSFLIRSLYDTSQRKQREKRTCNTSTIDGKRCCNEILSLARVNQPTVEPRVMSFAFEELP